MEWVSRHRILTDMALQYFMRTGEWPSAASLQRELDRVHIADDVTQAYGEMPRLPGHGVPEHDDHFRLPLHILACMDAAKLLMQACRQIIWRVISLYHSDVDVALLKNDDPQLTSDYHQDLLRRALDVLRESPPQPLGSGHYFGNVAWSFEVEGQAARRLTNVRSIDDYIGWQLETLQPSPAPKRKWWRRRADNERRLVHLAGRYAIAAAIIGAVIAALIGGNMKSIGNDNHGSTATSGAAKLTPSSSASSSTPPSSSPAASPTLEVDQSWLTAQNFCSWRLGTNHVPVLSAHPLQLRIDDRCNFPQHPDPQTDTPTRIFASASQESIQVGAIPDGTLITVRCYITEGEVVKDAEKNSSDIWLRITTPAGLIPNVNIGGGFTEQQLVLLGIKKC
jgi:hypothetical protein